MKYFVDDRGVGDADPERIRSQARQLDNVVVVMDRTVRLLRQLSVRGVWDAPSGETFAASVDDVPGDLVEIATRLRLTAGTIRPYADLLEASQQALAGHDEDAASASRAKKECDSRLAELAPEDPERDRVERERGRAVAALSRAERGFEKELQEARADEQRMAAKLHEASTESADPAGYDFWEGLSTLGQNASRVGIIAKPVALVGVGDPIGKAGRRIFYDEGSYRDVATSGAIYAVDTVGFGAARMVKAARNRFTATEVSRLDSLPHKPVRIRDNPITTRSARGPASSTSRARPGRRTQHHQPLPSRIPAPVRDLVRRKAGVDDVEKAFDDWAVVAGEGRVAKVAVVVEQSTAQGRRAYSAARTTSRTAESTGIKDGAQERREAERRRRATADRLAEGPPDDPRAARAR